MKLQRVRVQNYKSVEDSGYFTVGSLCCLAGKNESGKTAILQAIRRLNPVETSELEYDPIMEFPRRRFAQYSPGDKVEVLNTGWELSNEDVESVEIELGKGSIESRDVVITKGYSTDANWSFQLNHAAMIENLILKAPDLTDPAAGRIRNYSTIESLKDSLNKKGDERTVGENQVIETLSSFPGSDPSQKAKEILAVRLPRILYFDSYAALPGRVSVEAFAAADSDDLIESRIFRALLSLAGTDIKEIQESRLSKELIARLEGVSNSLSDEIFHYWSQNKDLRVQFRFDEARPDDPSPFNTGHVFITRIENIRHRVTVRFDERSAGFVWFFSFLVWFSQMKRNFGEGLIILLDEPGLSLHGTAQRDLLRYIKERLLPDHQVIYSTHSPFLIDTEDLSSVRTVEDETGPGGEILGTRVGDEVLSSDSETLFPLRAALSYDLTQSLFIGDNILLVEGPSDLLYLTWASNELKKAGRPGLDRRWTITPAGGLDKIGSFVALFGGNLLHVAVFTDFHSGDKRKVRTLKESSLLRDGHVFSADNYPGQTEADIEDLLGKEFYADLVNKCYGLADLRKVVPNEQGELIVQRVEEHFRTLPEEIPEFDHYSPSAYLIEHWAELEPEMNLTEEALGRFAALFTDLNLLLPSG